MSLVLQRVFAAVFMGLMMLSPAMASDLMFGSLQFRATVGSMPSSAAYLSITNHGAMDDRLLAVESSLARKTELHTMDVTNGVMKMRQVDGGIAIPAGAASGSSSPSPPFPASWCGGSPAASS